jgi:hypothetical protein
MPLSRLHGDGTAGIRMDMAAEVKPNPAEPVGTEWKSRFVGEPKRNFVTVHPSKNI